MLDRRAAALLDGDRAAYGATGAGAGFDRVGEVPLADWSYRVGEVTRTGATATAAVELRYRLDGYDAGEVRAARTVRLERADGTWRVTSDQPAGTSGGLPWDRG
ncbi:hypothetical protein NGM37_17185, partial [Streptomyces sp. TRM76130]|nr:hypothetical protein [Streptomyces sp. TRM76130]